MDSASVTATTERAPLPGVGLGDTQQAMLLALKRLGDATQAEIAREVPFAPATLREHLQSLVGRGLVQRRGSRRAKPGRPEVVYGLTERGNALFPSRAPDVLRELIVHLLRAGHTRLVERFFSQRVAARRSTALARVRGLTGTARVEAAARVLSEEGFMALVGGTPERPTLRLCHCPIRDVVSVTHIPCRYEQRLVAELLGRPLDRIEYLPDGDPACSYSEAVHSPEQESL